MPRAALLLLLGSLLCSACGVKGPPLPPLPATAGDSDPEPRPSASANPAPGARR